MNPIEPRGVRTDVALTIVASERAARRAPASAAHPFGAIARDHHDALVGFATRLCGDATEARDLVQDTFERALRRFDSFDRATNARAWLFSILHNAFIDRCRKRASVARTESIDGTFEAPEREDADSPRWAAISAEQLRGAIAALDVEFRVVYTLHAIDGRSYQEIATELGIPISTVGTRLARARRKLKIALVGLTPEEGSEP